MDKRLNLNKIVKSNISNSLLDLMHTKNFSDITITDIVTKAGVARASYYRNYDSKETIIREVIYEIIQTCKNSVLKFPRQDGPIKGISQLLNSVAEYNDIIKTIFHAGLSGLFLESITEFLKSTAPEKHLDDGDQWVVYAFAGALFNIINKWVQDDMKQSPEEIAGAFFKTWQNHNKESAKIFDRFYCPTKHE